MLLQKQGKLEEAVTAYHEALAINPHYAEVYNNRAYVTQTKKARWGFSTLSESC